MCAIPGDDRLGLRPGSSRYQAKMAYIPSEDGAHPGRRLCLYLEWQAWALFFVSAGGILYAISGRI